MQTSLPLPGTRACSRPGDDIIPISDDKNSPCCSLVYAASPALLILSGNAPPYSSQLRTHDTRLSSLVHHLLSRFLHRIAHLPQPVAKAAQPLRCASLCGWLGPCCCALTPTCRGRCPVCPTGL